MTMTGAPLERSGSGSALIQVAARDGASAAVAIGSPALVRSAREAFVHGMGLTLWVCSGIALVAIALALAFLPRRTGVPDPKPEEVATIGA
jgi:MFS transporter, DHA2 family, multidrug resistance protein